MLTHDGATTRLVEVRPPELNKAGRHLSKIVRVDRDVRAEYVVLHGARPEGVATSDPHEMLRALTS